MTRRLVKVRPFEASAFGPRTAGFHGECSLCPRGSRNQRAEYMAVSAATGKRFALCRHHAVPYQYERAGVNSRDVAAAREAIRRQFRRNP